MTEEELKERCREIFYAETMRKIDAIQTRSGILDYVRGDHSLLRVLWDYYPSYGVGVLMFPVKTYEMLEGLKCQESR